MSQINSFEQFNTEIEKVISHYKNEFNRNDVTKINLTLLENIFVDYFGSKTAVKYLGNIKKGDKGEFYFVPFVVKMMSDIYQAIVNYGLSWKLTLQKDMIFIALPVITTDRKLQLIKDWKLKTEHCHVQIRKLRHNFLNYWRDQEKLVKEELIQKQQQIQKIMDQTNHYLDDFLKEKTTVLLKV